MIRQTAGILHAIAMCVFVCAAFLFADIKNPDKPLQGIWDFKPQKVWQIENVGDEVFAHPFTLRISENGLIYIFDMKAEINYIFDQDGKFVKAFAKGGEGPGEIIAQGRTFIIKNNVIITGMNGIHYFTEQGEYRRSTKEAGLGLPIHLFLSEDELIAAPLTGIHTPDGKGKIHYKNLRSKEERILAEFSAFQGGIGQSEGGSQVFDMIVVGMSPLLTMAHDKGRVYWGMSDDYTIHISDLEGKLIDSFSINRKKSKLSKRNKKKYFQGIDLPIEALDQIVDSFPEGLSYFHRIEVHNGLIFVYVPELDFEAGHSKIKQIDIFSLEGKYLYCAKIELEQGLTPLFSPLENLVFTKDFLYAVCEKKDDSVVLVKYQITFPK